MPMDKINCNECGAALDADGGTRYVTCRRCSSRLEIKRTESSIFTRAMEQPEQAAENMPGVLRFDDERGEAATEDAAAIGQDAKPQELSWDGTAYQQVLSLQEHEGTEPSIFAALERGEQQTEGMPEVLEFLDARGEEAAPEVPAEENPAVAQGETKSQRLEMEWAARHVGPPMLDKGGDAVASATRIGLPLITAVGSYGVFWIGMAFWIVNQNPASDSLGFVVALPLAVTAFTCVAIFYGLKLMRRQALAGEDNGNYLSAPTTSMGLLLIATVGGYGVFWIVLAFWMANQANRVPALIVILPLFVTAFTCVAIFRGLKMITDAERRREPEEGYQRKRAMFLDRPENTN
jgi:DNA-directed RNA polymerase subunit RPC12/RpoP